MDPAWSKYRDQVNEACIARILPLCQEWLPGGHQSGDYYKCASLAGGAGESVRVRLSTGQWGEWAGKERGRDLVSLFRAIKSLPKYGAALDELALRFGIQKPNLKHGPAQTWDVVCPIPPQEYRTDDAGNALLPDLDITKGVTQFWPYYDADANLLCYRLRWTLPDGKKEVKPLTFCRRRSDGDTEWRLRELPAPLPLYNLLGLSSHPPKILIVEGEKTADAGARLLPDWCVTTWPGGGQKAQQADWAQIVALSDARIVLWPDHDKPGELAMSRAAEMLSRNVEVVRPDPTWPEGYDLADLEADGWDAERVESWIASHSSQLRKIETKTRPSVDLTGKDYKRQVGELHAAIMETGADMYRTEAGPVIVRMSIHDKPEIHRLQPADFRSWCIKHVDTYHYNGNGKAPYPVNDDLAHACLFHAPDALPRLIGFSEIPVFCREGKLLDQPGYNARSGIWIKVPEGYTPGMDVGSAIELIDDLLADFPFEKEADRTHAIAYVVTAIMRLMIDGPTPMFRFEAPTPGTGKSMLCRGLTELFSPEYGDYSMPEDDTEFSKFLTGALVEKEPVIVFDNCEKLEGKSLELALTSTVWKGRILGQSETREFPIRNLWAATLNNPMLPGSMLRRTIRIRLNANMENPEQRDVSKFRHPDWLSDLRKNRGALVSAFVTICAHGMASHTPANIPRLGSYESWIRAVFPILQVNGWEGFLSTVPSDLESAQDGRKSSFRGFVESWARTHGAYEVSVKELCLIAADQDLQGVRKGKDGRVSPGSLGWFLKTKRQAVVSGLQVSDMITTRAGNCYKLTATEDQGQEIINQRLENSTYSAD